MKFKTPNLLSIIVLLILLSSCDPGQIMIFSNETDYNLTIRIIEVGNSSESIKNNINDRNNYNEAISDTTIIKLGIDNLNRTDTIDFGIGTWEVLNRLDSFLIHLKEVALLNDKETIVIRDKSQLDNLFRSNLTGDYKETIIVKFE